MCAHTKTHYGMEMGMVRRSVSCRADKQHLIRHVEGGLAGPAETSLSASMLTEPWAKLPTSKQSR